VVVVVVEVVVVGFLDVVVGDGFLEEVVDGDGRFVEVVAAPVVVEGDGTGGRAVTGGSVLISTGNTFGIAYSLDV